MKASILLATTASLLPHSTRITLAISLDPFDADGYTYTAPSGFSLNSANEDGYDGFATDGTTSVYSPSGDLLYTMPIFSGRRELSLSPDGSVVVMDGDRYHGTTYMRTRMYTESDPIVTSVYLNGTLWRDVKYDEDLDGPEMVEEERYGWAHRPFTLDVDWESGVLAYDVGEANSTEVSRGRRRANDVIHHVEISLPVSGAGV